MSVHPHPDFARRIERSLNGADTARRWHQWKERARLALPVVLLAGPVIGWHLLQHTPGSGHMAVAALATVAFILDVGVHLDTSLLSSLGLADLPTVVGLLLLVMVAASVLWREDK
ncbi:MAG TPA: hypothetical protein VFB58_07765 [Chloroflexota bacterium]|nr:hypothetical protein [Chloroflexota bacterium]